MRFSVIIRTIFSSFPHFRAFFNVIVCFYVKTVFILQKTKNKPKTKQENENLQRHRLENK